MAWAAHMVAHMGSTHVAFVPGTQCRGSAWGLTFLPNEQEEIVDVSLQRISTATISDQVTLFDLFTRIASKAEETKDAEALALVQTARELWSHMSQGRCLWLFLLQRSFG